jgi:hypothetical protein
MGMVVMSKCELNHVDVLARLESGKLADRAAAELMTITLRQTYRLFSRCQSARRRPSNNRLPKRRIENRSELGGRHL